MGMIMSVHLSVCPSVCDAVHYGCTPTLSPQNMLSSGGYNHIANTQNTKIFMSGLTLGLTLVVVYFSVQKRRTLRRTLLQYQRDCQSLDAPTAGGASNIVNPLGCTKLATIARDSGAQGSSLAASTSHQPATGKTLASVSFKPAADAGV